MLDKLDRLLANKGNIESELQDMASDALVVLWHYIVAKIEIDQKREEEENEEETMDSQAGQT